MFDSSSVYEFPLRKFDCRIPGLEAREDNGTHFLKANDFLKISKDLKNIGYLPINLETL